MMKMNLNRYHETPTGTMLLNLVTTVQGMTSSQ